MSYKTFTSQSGWFSLTLPVDWEEYDDEDTDEGTYAFLTVLTIKKDLLEDDLVIYYWAAGKKDNLFICSFTIDKKQEQTEQNKTELSIVEDIIKSIKIN